MKFRFLHTFMMCWCLTDVFAQFSPQVSFSTGLSIGNQTFKYSVDSLNGADFINNSLIGIPVTLGINFTNRAGFRFGVNASYLQKGYTGVLATITDVNSSNPFKLEKVVFRTDYLSLSVPISYVFSLTKNLNLVGSFAPRVDFDLRKKPNSIDFLAKRERVLVGINGALGAEYLLNSNWTLLCEMQFQYDLTPFMEIDLRGTQNGDMGTFTLKNYLYTLQAGIGYNF